MTISYQYTSMKTVTWLIYENIKWTHKTNCKMKILTQLPKNKHLLTLIKLFFFY